MINNQEFDYDGELDADGRAHGFGKAINGEQTVEATFVADQLEGLSK